MSDNVISLPSRATPLDMDNERVLAERQRRGDALEIARLSILDHVEYERARIEAAKKLGVRISFLDKTIERIRERIRDFEAAHVVAAPDGLKGVNFHHDDGCVTAGIILRKGRHQPARKWNTETRSYDETPGSFVDLIMLADGFCTIVNGMPTGRC
jgi:hypothetical protein